MHRPLCLSCPASIPPDLIILRPVDHGITRPQTHPSAGAGAGAALLLRRTAYSVDLGRGDGDLGEAIDEVNHWQEVSDRHSQVFDLWALYLRRGTLDRGLCKRLLI
jgi:hypothetical protein